MSDQNDYNALTQIAAKHRTVYDAVVKYRDALIAVKKPVRTGDRDSNHQAEDDYNPAESDAMYAKKDLAEAIRNTHKDEVIERPEHEAADALAKNIEAWVMNLGRIEPLNELIDAIDTGKVDPKKGAAIKGETCSVQAAPNGVPKRSKGASKIAKLEEAGQQRLI